MNGEHRPPEDDLSASGAAMAEVREGEAGSENPFLAPAANPPPVVEFPPAAADFPPAAAELPPAAPPLPPAALEGAPAPGPVARMLAGLESGILGAVLMIGWFALDSVLERQHWWAMLNLWGAGIYNNRVFTMGFGIATAAGASLHFFLHGIGGAVWAIVASKISNYWLHLVCSFGAAAMWYLLLMHAFWPAVAPVVSRIAPPPATILAYFLFGAALSRTASRARQLDIILET